MGVIITKKGIRRTVSINMSVEDYCVIRDAAAKNNKKVSNFIYETCITPYIVKRKRHEEKKIEQSRNFDENTH